MEIKRISKLSEITLFQGNKEYPIEFFGESYDLEGAKIIQIVKEEDILAIEYIPKDKITAYESGIDKIEQSQEEPRTINHVDAKLFEARKTVLNKDIFAGGKYSGKEIGYIIDNDPEYIDMYLQKSTNTYIKDKIQYILDNMEG